MGLVFSSLHLYIQDREKASLVSLEASVSLWHFNKTWVSQNPYSFLVWLSANPSSLPPAFIPSSRGQRVLATPHFISCIAALQNHLPWCRFSLFIPITIPALESHLGLVGALQEAQDQRAPQELGTRERRVLALPLPAGFVLMQPRVFKGKALC